MGKAEDEQPTSLLPASSTSAEAPGGNAGAGWCLNRCCCCGRSIASIVRPRCVAVLVLGVAVLLSALFWLPPFLRHSGAGSSDRDPMHTADIVASFRLQRPVDQLYDNIVKLQYDIFEEIGVRDSLVAVISLEPLSSPNWTNVVFGVWPDTKNSNLSSTALSILRSYFMSLVVQQSTLHLTTSLSGNSSLFEVLKFPGGITIIPPQSVFPLQKVQMLFNFTLNFPIYRVQEKISELKDQMKSGLLLNPNENLYVRLTNLEGSTVAPPTIVRTSVVLEVGNRQPSLPRWKQLAHNIRNSSAGNLGLNHTVFGKVKQIRLSTFLQHSPNQQEGMGSPSPSPHIDYHHHHHHHHHHLHHHYGLYPAPVPAPNPAPEHVFQTPPPSGCQYRFPSKPKQYNYSPPSKAPMTAPKSSASPAAAPHRSASPLSSPHRSASPSRDSQDSTSPSSAPDNLLAPHMHDNPPAPAPHGLRTSPLPAVSFAHIPPPSGSVTDNKAPPGMPRVAPSPYASSASSTCGTHWILVLLLYGLTSL